MSTSRKLLTAASLAALIAATALVSGPASAQSLFAFLAPAQQSQVQPSAPDTQQQSRLR